MAGGVAASVVNVRNCYNTGKISASASARGYIGEQKMRVDLAAQLL